MIQESLQFHYVKNAGCFGTHDRTDSKCYSSGISLRLDKETFDAVCDKCRK